MPPPRDHRSPSLHKGIRLSQDCDPYRVAMKDDREIAVKLYSERVGMIQREELLRKKIDSAVSKKPKVQFLVCATPLDYSFRGIVSLSGLEHISPRAGPARMLERLANRAGEQATDATNYMHPGRSLGPPPSPDGAEPEVDVRWDDGHEQADAAKTRDTLFECLVTAATKGTRVKSKLRKPIEALQITKSLRMNNNELQSVENMGRWLTPVLMTPHKLQWLDLSFNEVGYLPGRFFGAVNSPCQ
jgi:hypothetical protein